MNFFVQPDILTLLKSIQTLILTTVPAIYKGIEKVPTLLKLIEHLPQLK